MIKGRMNSVSFFLHETVYNVEGLFVLEEINVIFRDFIHLVHFNSVLNFRTQSYQLVCKISFHSVYPTE